MQNSTNELKSKTKALEEIDISTAGVADIIALKIAKDIDDYAIKTYGAESYRWHLGASLIGHECSRYLWYVFHWCFTSKGYGDTEEKKETSFGRSLRLTQRGHLEESRFVEYLQGIGMQVITHDESKPKANGEFLQYRMSAVAGHFGGSRDGLGFFPPSYCITEPVLLEFKTKGTGRGFNDVKTDGVAHANPTHYAQICTYGAYWELRYALYMVVNKNDDDLAIEVVKLDWNFGNQMLAKAERIIRSEEPPPRISNQPTFFQCKFCAAHSICHGTRRPDINCRSCKFSTPVPGGEWFCNQHNAEIPRDVVPKACEQYKAIVNAA